MPTDIGRPGDSGLFDGDGVVAGIIECEGSDFRLQLIVHASDGSAGKGWVGVRQRCDSINRSDPASEGLSIGVITAAVRTGSAGIGIAGGELISAEVLEIPSVILVEALEAIVKVNGRGEGVGDCECNFAGRGDCDIITSRRYGAGIVILYVELIGSRRG